MLRSGLPVTVFRSHEAMDTVSRRRRAGGSSEPEPAGVNPELLYQAALSQASQEMTLSRTARSGEASPGLLEAGGIPSSVGQPALPEAHPFYSPRAKAEVQLARSRPSTLDDDGRRLQSEFNEAALGDSGYTTGQEPNYGALDELQGASEAPRVARVESGNPRPEDDHTEIKEEVAGGNPSAKIPLGREGEGRPEEGPVIISQAAATTVSSEDDQRELVPVEASRIERLESLLLEVVEENKSLKRRLQTESNSSWETGVTLRMISLRSWISRFHPRHSWSFRGSLKFV